MLASLCTALTSCDAHGVTTGESFFLTTLSNPASDRDDGFLVAQLSPQLPGEVYVVSKIPAEGLVLTHGAFLAAGEDVTIASRIQRNVANSLLSGTGFGVLDVRGRGPVAFSGFGALMVRQVAAGEELLVDNGSLRLSR